VYLYISHTQHIIINMRRFSSNRYTIFGTIAYNCVFYDIIYKEEKRREEKKDNNKAIIRALDEINNNIRRTTDQASTVFVCSMSILLMH
jgi:hypothetical protein